MKTLITAALIPVSLLCLQAAPPMNAGSSPLSKSASMAFSMMMKEVMQTAEEMPESNYDFKPVDTVRSFGQVLGHIADGQYEFCSAAMGDKSFKAPEVEKTAKSKAELTEALKTAFGYCQKAYDGMTDEHAAEAVDFFGRQMPKLAVLNFNIAHTDEHYGNLATYLRIKGLVPPTSKH